MGYQIVCDVCDITFRKADWDGAEVNLPSWWIGDKGVTLELTVCSVSCLTTMVETINDDQHDHGLTGEETEEVDPGIVMDMPDLPMAPPPTMGMPGGGNLRAMEINEVRIKR